MAYRKQIEITPSTITNLTVVVKDNTFFTTLTLDDFTLDGDVLTGRLTVSDNDTPISIYSQGYEPIITTFDNLSNSITLTPTSDYIKTSDGTNNYYVKDNYSRQFGNDLLDIVMTKADSSDIPTAVTESTVSDWGFTKNTGTVTSVNNVSPVNGNVTLNIPSTDNLANTDLSNLSTTGQAVIDGKVSKSDLNSLSPLRYSRYSIAQVNSTNKFIKLASMTHTQAGNRDFSYLFWVEILEANANKCYALVKLSARWNNTSYAGHKFEILEKYGDVAASLEAFKTLTYAYSLDTTTHKMTVEIWLEIKNAGWVSYYLRPTECNEYGDYSNKPITLSDNIWTYYNQSGNASSIASTAITSGLTQVKVTDATGVRNENDLSKVIKTWIGTKAQYDAIVTKDTNTLYNIEGVGLYKGNNLISGAMPNSANQSLSNLDTTGQAVIDGKVSKSGDTMTGDLTIEQAGLHTLWTDTDSTVTPSSQLSHDPIIFQDANGVGMTYIGFKRNTNGSYLSTLATRKNDGTGWATFNIGYNTSGYTYCDFPNTDRVDGQWVNKVTELVSNVSMNNTSRTFSLNNYLPNDGNKYEVLFVVIGRTGTTSGNYMLLFLNSGIAGGNVEINRAITRSSSYSNAGGNVILPCKYGQNVTLQVDSNATCTNIYVTARAYRRIGTNA